jgi:RNA polymerase sigma-B factor
MEAAVKTGPDSGARPSEAHSRRRRSRQRVSSGQRQIEEQLLRQYSRTGSPAVRDQLVSRFMPLARSLAMRYRGGTEPLDDLVQVAALGLVKAIEGFEPERGKPFTAYAVPTMLGELRRHFRDNVWSVHLPRSLQERTLAIEQAVGKLTEQHGRSPTVAEIAGRLELTEDEVVEALHADQARRTVSLDVPMRRDQEDSAPAIESVRDDEAGYDRVEAQAASECADLDEREIEVLRMRFEENLTQYEIGQRLGVSQMQISRIMRRALRKLLDAVRGGPAVEELVGGRNE